MANRVLIKRGLSTNLSNAGVVDGELKYATDENKLYIGNGVENIAIGGGGGTKLYHKQLYITSVIDSGSYIVNHSLIINYYDTDSNETNDYVTLTNKLEMARLFEKLFTVRSKICEHPIFGFYRDYNTIAQVVYVKDSRFDIYLNAPNDYSIWGFSIWDSNNYENTTVDSLTYKIVNLKEIGGVGGGNSSQAEWGEITGTITSQTDLINELNNKQDGLVSGTNIKTINNQSILGSGNINIESGGYTAIYHKFLRLIEGDTPFNEVLVNFYSTDPSYIHLQGTTIQDVNLKQWIANNIFNGETNVQLGMQFQLLRRGNNADIQYPIITDSKIYWYNNQMTFSYIYWTIENGTLTRKSSSITLQNSGTYNTWGHGYVQTIGKIV